MSNITWDDKIEGGEFTHTDANAIKTAVNSKADSTTALTTWASVTPSSNGQSLVSAANYAAMRGLLDLEPGVDYDASTPSTLILTTSASVTEAQILANRYFSNYGAAGAVVATLPAVYYNITRTFLVETAQVFSVKPPSGESLDTTITPVLDADDKISSPATAFSRVVVTRIKTGASTWRWSVDIVRGAWTDGGA